MQVGQLHPGEEINNCTKQSYKQQDDVLNAVIFTTGTIF